VCVRVVCVCVPNRDEPAARDLHLVVFGGLPISSKRLLYMQLKCIPLALPSLLHSGTSSIRGLHSSFVNHMRLVEGRMIWA
jgi:hypothetical protein